MTVSDHTREKQQPNLELYSAQASDKALKEVNGHGSGRVATALDQRERSRSVVDNPQEGFAEIQPRADGYMMKFNPAQRQDGLAVIDKDDSVVRKKFDSSRRSDGLQQELTSIDGKTCMRMYDPAKSSQGILAESVVKDPVTLNTTTERRYVNGKDGLFSEKTVKDACGNEHSTYNFKEKGRVEVDRVNGKEVVKKYDASGKEIIASSPEAKPQKSVEDKLADYRRELEARNQLPAIKNGQGPWQSVQEAISKGQLPAMSAADAKAEAVRIRDRDFKASGKDYYRVGERPQFYSREEMDAKIAQRRQEMGVAEAAARPKEEVRPAQVVTQPKEEARPAQVVTQPKEEVRPAQVVTQPKEEVRPAQVVTQPKEEARPAKVVTQPKEEVRPTATTEARPETKVVGTQDLAAQQKPDVARSKDELAELAIRKIGDAKEREQFKQDLGQFVARQDISLDEKSKTIANVKTLLDAPESFAAPGAEGLRRNMLGAEGIMHHAANPDSIMQGMSGFCGPSSVEYSLLLTRPSVASDMVKSSLLTGQWTGSDKQSISIDKSLLVPNVHEHAGSGNFEEKKRSFATQVLGSLVMNEVGQHLNPKRSFVEDEADAGKANQDDYYRIGWKDASGKVMSLLPDADKKNVETGIVDPTGGLTAWQLSESWARITGDKNAVIQSASYKYDGSAKDKGYIEAKIGRGAPDGAPNQGLEYVAPSAEGLSHLKQYLKEKVQDGKSPVMAQVVEKYVHELWINSSKSGSGNPDVLKTDPPNVFKPHVPPDHFVAVKGVYEKDGKTYVTIHNSADGHTFSMPIESFQKALSS